MILSPLRVIFLTKLSFAKSNKRHIPSSHISGEWFLSLDRPAWFTRIIRSGEAVERTSAPHRQTDTISSSQLHYAAPTEFCHFGLLLLHVQRVSMIAVDNARGLPVGLTELHD